MTLLVHPLLLMAWGATLCPAQAAWTQLQPIAAPTARDGTRLAWDHAREEVLMFGGDGHSPQSDTWAWNGSSWTQLGSATSPPARAFAAMAYDHANREVVLFGGFPAATPPRGRVGLR